MPFWRTHRRSNSEEGTRRKAQVECERGFRHQTKGALMEKQVAENEAGAFQGQAGRESGRLEAGQAQTLLQHSPNTRGCFSLKTNDSHRRPNNQQKIRLQEVERVNLHLWQSEIVNPI